MTHNTFSEITKNDKNLIMDEQATINQTLLKIPWFHELSPGAMNRLAQSASMRVLNPGELLFREGETENCLYVLMDGELDLETHVPGYGQVHIFTAEPLDVIGWSVLTPVVRQRTDTARAISYCKLIAFNSELLRQQCEEDREFGYVIMRRIANVAASRLLTTRLHMFEVIRKLSELFHTQERSK